MSSDTHIQLLSQTDTFQGVSTGVLRLALQAAHVRQVKRDQFLISEGELATAFYVLTEGHAKMLRLTPDGHEILVKYIRPWSGSWCHRRTQRIRVPLCRSGLGRMRGSGLAR